MRHVAEDEAPEGAVMSVTTGPGLAVVTLRGEHDLVSKDELAETLAQQLQARPLVVVDLTETTFIDSSAISVLVRAKEDADTLGRTLQVRIADNGIVHRVFEICGLLETFSLATSRGDTVEGAGFLPPAA